MADTDTNDEDITNDDAEKKVEAADEQVVLPGTDEPEPEPEKVDLAALKAEYEKKIEQARADAEKATKKAIAAERKKLEDEQKVKAERAKMDEAERLKAEKADAEKSLADARAELQAQKNQVALYRLMSAEKLSPAAPTATPMIESAFAAALAANDDDAEAAMAAVKKDHAFLFAAPAEAAPQKAEKKTGKATTGATKRPGEAPPKKPELPPRGRSWEQTVAAYNRQRQSH